MVSESVAKRSFESMIALVAELDIDKFPENVVEHIGLIMADTVAVSIAGWREPEMRGLRDTMAQNRMIVESQVGVDERHHGMASLLPSGRFAADPARAAFLNATAGSFLELDEGMRPTGHAGMHVIPAALAVGESVGATGREVLRAAVAGYEVAGRLFGATKLKYPVHPHGHLGAVGAAVASALLLGLDPLEPALVAITTPLLPVWDSCYDGATARNTFMGHAAQNGVMASYLTMSGFTGSASAYSAAFGQIAGEIPNVASLAAPIDYLKPRVMHNYFKRHSACALSHAAIDAVLLMDLPHDAQITDVHVETVSNNMKLNRMPVENSLSARFSLPYAVATAMRLGRTDPSAFSSYREDVAELAQKVRVSASEELDKDWPDYWPARVVVHAEGAVIERYVRNARGHYSDRLTTQELRAKFNDLVANDSQSDALWNTLTHLHQDTTPLIFGTP